MVKIIDGNGDGNGYGDGYGYGNGDKCFTVL